MKDDPPPRPEVLAVWRGWSVYKRDPSHLYPTANKQTTRWFLSELHRRYQLDTVEFLVNDTDYLGPVFAEDGYRFQVICHGNRNAIERVVWETKRGTSLFANSFSTVTLETAQEWLEALAVYHNSRQN